MTIKVHFAEILKKYHYTIHPGDIVAGTIIHYEKSGFLVEIGTNKSGYLPTEELTLNSRKKHNKKLLVTNITKDFFLLTQNKENKQYILSLRRLDYIRSWKRIKQMYKEDIIFNLKIERINKGGLITYLEGIQGFIPKSHIYTQSKNKYYQSLKNKYIKCKLLTLDDHKNQLILSNKSANFNSLKHKFKLGELIYGEIEVIKTYGVFLNIYSFRALLHKSEIRGEDLYNTKLLLKRGKLIKAKIIYLNTSEGLISVSIKDVDFIFNPLLQH